MNELSAKRIKTKLNIGSISAFQLAEGGSPLLDDDGCRNSLYRTDEHVDKFPLIYHPNLLDVCCEMNLYLIQRARGEYSTQRNRKEMSFAWSRGYIASMRGKPIDHKTIDSISKDLKLFLDFLIKKNLSYLEVVVVPTAESDRELLPVWQYQRSLCERVKGKDLGWGTAQRMICRVRAFYLWSYHRGLFDKLPFSLELKAIRKKKENDYDILFTLPNKKASSGAVTAWVSDLSIPKKYKQKSKKPEGLQPFSRYELAVLLQTDVAKHNTYGLFLKCAYLAGLRSFEVVEIDYSDIVNPADKPNQVVFKIGMIRKHHMPKPINISRSLMTELFAYTQSQSWLNRRKKHETKYGMNNPEEPLPLFINRAGERMADTSPRDAIGHVRKEQRAKGVEVLERGYHDLRATFGTYLAMYLIQKFKDPRRVRAILRKWMGHEDIKTTELYIDFAKTADPSEFGEMHDWVEDIYSAVNKLMEGK
ncbi:site-specific integrase [Vibrio cholerae]